MKKSILVFLIIMPFLALAQIPPTTVSDQWALVYDTTVDGMFNGTAQMTGGSLTAFGRIDTSLPVITDPGFRINSSGIQLELEAGERFYARAYQGTAVIQLVRSGGGGGGGQIPVVNANSPFASIAARNSYFTTNPSELLNNSDFFTVVSITGGTTFRWSGESEPTVYDTDSWVEMDGMISADDRAAIDSIKAVTPGALLMGTAQGISDSGGEILTTPEGLKQYMFDGEINVPSGGGVRFGQNDIGGGGNIFGGASNVRIANSVNNTEGYLASVIVDDNGSSKAFYPDFGAVRNDPSPADQSETFTGNPGHRFAFNNPLPGRVTQYTIHNPSAETFTGCDFTIWENGYDQDILFTFSGASAGVDKFFSMAPGDNVIAPPEPIGFPPTGTRIFAEIICSSGNVQMSGQTIPFPLDPLNPGGGTENVEFPYLAFIRNFSTRQELEDSLGLPASDGQVLSSTTAGVRSWISAAINQDHPVTLRRDMPTQAEAQALADSSLNQNSALWVIANDQLETSNRADALIRAQRAGFLDLDGNEIPITDVAANTIQMRGGSTVRIFGGNEYRVVNSPVFEGDIPDPIAPIEINASSFTLTAANYTDYLDRVIRLTNTNTSIAQEIRFASVSSFLSLVPDRDVSFSFVVNRGTAGLRADFIPAGGDSIGGTNFQQRFEDETITITLPSSGTNWLITSSQAEQQLSVEVDALESAVATLQNTIFNSGRSFIRFNDGFTIDNANLATYEDKNVIYTAKNDKPLDNPTRPDVTLPTDADIAAAGESYPITFEFTHLGGTARSTTANIVRFFFEGAQIGQIFRDDVAIIVKTGVGVPYDITTGNFDPNDTILPTGVFNLKVDTPITDIADIATEFAGVSIVAGDAYVVITGGTWSGLTIPNNSILVATVNSPSLADSANNNDWLLLDNPRVNAKSAAFLANFEQDGILFNGTRNVQVDPANVFEFSAIATGTPQARALGTNTQGSGRSIIYANVPIQFNDLVGGRLAINLNFNIDRVTGFSPSFNTVRLEYPGGIVFDFPVTGAPINGNFMATIDIPNVDYSAALNQDCTLTLFYDFFGASFFGEYTVLNVINTSTGRLHDAISDLIVSESVPLETRLQAQIDNIIGEVGGDEASFAAIQDRISPYRNNVSLSPNTNVRYLDSTGSDNFPEISAMTAVNPLNTQYTMGTAAVFIAVAVGTEQAVMNGGTQTLLTSANAQADPNLELGESGTFEGRTYFVYRLSNQAVNDVIQTFDLTFVQVVAWQDDINTLDADINRIDAELEHAALNLSDGLIQVLDNSVTVTEESNPTILPTPYNKSFSTNDTQTIFYEANPKAPSAGTHASDAISASSAKLVVIPEDHVFSDGVILQADNGTTTTDLVSFSGGQLVANVFVPAVGPGSKTVTVHPLPATQVQRDWYSIPLHTPDLRSEADELFFTRDVPIAATTLNFQYRYDANGGHGATQSINLVITDINQDASTSATLSLPDGESVNVGFDWQAAQRRIRVTGTPFASDPNFFIFDMEVGVTFTETRTTPATPATTRPVNIGLQRATGQDAVIATKVSSGGNLILVGDVAEVDTNYAMTTLFGGALAGNLIVSTEIGTYLNYTQFTPSAQTVVSLEDHATLPQFGLFTTEYTSATIVTFDTQLEAKDSAGNTVKLGQELILIDTGDGDRYRITISNGVLTPVKL